MRTVLILVFLILFCTNPLYALELNAVDCQKKEDICEMMKTLSHFQILDHCPNAAPLLTECKKSSSATYQPLPEPRFKANEDGTITDTANNLTWMKSGVNEKFSLKTADEMALNSEAHGLVGWRIPTLPELASLLQTTQNDHAGGKKSWVHPLFNDTGEYYYWTTTTCEEVTEITDRYQKKICQQGPGAAWLLNFKAGAIIWHFVDSKKFYAWLVRNNE